MAVSLSASPRGDCSICGRFSYFQRDHQLGDWLFLYRYPWCSPSVPLGRILQSRRFTPSHFPDSHSVSWPVTVSLIADCLRWQNIQSENRMWIQIPGVCPSCPLREQDQPERRTQLKRRGEYPDFISSVLTCLLNSPSWPFISSVYWCPVDWIRHAHHLESGSASRSRWCLLDSRLMLWSCGFGLELLIVSC